MNLNYDALCEVHLCQHLKEQGLTRAKISQELNLSDRRVKTRLGQVRLAAAQGLIPVKEYADSHPITLDAQALKQEQFEADQATVTTTETTRLLRREYGLEALVAAFKGVVPPMQPIPVSQPKERPKERKELFAAISDLHIGKKTPDFNSSIAQTVVDDFIHQVVDKGKAEGVSHLNLGLIGDEIDGINIYRAQVHETDGAGVDQVITAVKTFGYAIAYVLQNTDWTIDIIGVAGNHGVVSKIERGAEHENWEYLIHRLLQVWFENEPRIKFHIQSPHEFYVYHKRVLYFHGHQIAGGGNVEKIVSRCRAWASGGLGKPVRPKLFVCGHFHRYQVAPVQQDVFLLVNGTASKSDSFIAAFGSIHTNFWHCWTAWVNQDGMTAVDKFFPIYLY